MDKMLDIILENVPAAIIPAIVAAVALYFGVFYFKGYRNYTDALHDRLFLSGLVILVGFFVLAQIHKDRVPDVTPQSTAPVLIVPEFADDERGQFRTLFVQYLDSALSAVDKTARPVMTLDTFLTDVDGARLTGKKYGANAVVYAPRVVRIKDKMVVCFTVYVMEGGLSKAYPPVSIEIDKATLDDLAQTLIFNQNTTATATPPNPIVARLDALEKQVADLRVASMKTQEAKATSTHVTYKTKRALLVGVDTHLVPKFPPLRFAVSDARRAASALEERGFLTTVLANPTKDVIEKGVQDLVDKSDPEDLIVVYMTGMTVRSTDLGFGGKPILILPASDLSTDDMRANLDLPRLVAVLDKAMARHKLVVIDGCHGTTGLEPAPLAAGSSPSPKDAVQVIAGSQDDQFGFESAEAGGGILTTAFIQAVRKAAGRDDLSIPKTFEEVRAAVEAMSRGFGSRQTPKLMNVRGSGTIFL